MLIKKIFAAFLTLIFATSANCWAVSALYYVKGIKTADMQPIVENGYTSNKFHMVKQNPYYGIASSGSDSAVVIIQQSGENMFYYYKSPEENLKVNKAVLKDLKKRGITVEQSFNTSLIEVYDNLAQEVMSQTETLKTYNFDEPQSPAFEPPVNNQMQYNKPAIYKGYVTQLSAGTKIQAYLQNAINTATAAQGDKIVAVLTNALTYNGQEVAPQGSLVYGTLTKARPAAFGSRNGRVVISFTQLVTPENKVYNISAEEIDFTVSNEGKVGETFKSAAGAAVAGALVGLLVGALTGGDHIGRNVAIGAGVGAGVFPVVEAGAGRA